MDCREDPLFAQYADSMLASFQRLQRAGEDATEAQRTAFREDAAALLSFLCEWGAHRCVQQGTHAWHCATEVPLHIEQQRSCLLPAPWMLQESDSRDGNGLTTCRAHQLSNCP